MKILCAFEESQAVTIELRKLGHEAYSCDLLDCSGGYPEWHIKGDAIKELYSGKYDMAICFPPCTDIAVSGAAWFEEKRKDGRQQAGIDLFMKVVHAPIEKICIENPVGIMSTIYREPDQKIQPYWFGDEAQKTTCLWLKNLNKLEPTNIVGKGEMHVGKRKNGKEYKMAKWYNDARSGNHGHKRSKTFTGIAKAMAEQFIQPLKQTQLFYN